MERVVFEYSGAWCVDLHSDNGLYMGCEVELVRYDDENQVKAKVIKAALDAWDQLGHPSPDLFLEAIKTAC